MLQKTLKAAQPTFIKKKNPLNLKRDGFFFTNSEILATPGSSAARGDRKPGAWGLQLSQSAVCR